MQQIHCHHILLIVIIKKLFGFAVYATLFASASILNNIYTFSFSLFMTSPKVTRLFRVYTL